MTWRSTCPVWLFGAALFVGASGCGGGDEVSEANTDETTESSADAGHSNNTQPQPGGTDDSSSNADRAGQDPNDDESDGSNTITDQNQGDDTTSNDTTDDRTGIWAEIDLSDLSTLLGKNMSKLTEEQRAQVADAIRNAEVDYAMTVDEFKASIPNFEAGEKYTDKVIELTGVVRGFTRRTHLVGEPNPNVRFGLDCFEINEANRLDSAVECHPIGLTPWLECLPTQEITVRGVCYANAAQVLNAVIIVDKKDVDLPQYEANELFQGYANDPTARFDHFSEAPVFILKGTVASVREDKESFMLVTDAQIEHRLNGGSNDAVFDIEPGDEIEALCHFSKFVSDDSTFVITTTYLLSIGGEAVTE